MKLKHKSMFYSTMKFDDTGSKLVSWKMESMPGIHTVQSSINPTGQERTNHTAFLSSGTPKPTVFTCYTCQWCGPDLNQDHDGEKKDTFVF